MKAHSQLLFLLFFLCLGVPAHAEVKCWDRAGLKQYVKEVARENQWLQASEGWVNGGDIQHIKVSFNSKQCLEVPAARRLFVSEIHKAVSRIQAKQSSKTLKRMGRPFSFSDLCYVVFFSDDKRTKYPDPYLYYVMLTFGSVIYRTEARLIHEESFEEALRIVEEETPS